jgi:hypothetical protein
MKSWPSTSRTPSLDRLAVARGQRGRGRRFSYVTEEKLALLLQIDAPTCGVRDRADDSELLRQQALHRHRLLRSP